MAAKAPVAGFAADTFPTATTSHSTRLDKTERLLLLSGSFTDAQAALGLRAIQRAITKADNNAVPATLRAIEDALREAHPDALDDDVTLIVLAPSGMISHGELTSPAGVQWVGVLYLVKRCPSRAVPVVSTFRWMPFSGSRAGYELVV